MSDEKESTNDHSFKHLSVLRKALSEGHTGEIVYQTVGEEEGQINVIIGDLTNGEKTVQALEKLLTEPIANCELIIEHIDQELESIAPPMVFTCMMNDIHWSPDVLQKLKKTFAKLPPIDVKIVPMHRYGYNDVLTYLMLYQQSLKDEEFTIVKFFNERPSYTTLEQQIKVLILVYCLGLINSKTSSHVKPKADKLMNNHRIGIVNRILNKIRGG